MDIPDWVSKVLVNYEIRTIPFYEVEIAEALHGARKKQGEQSDEAWQGFVAEWSAFNFHERRNKDGVWGTYFSPMMSAKRDDGSDSYSPDIRDLSLETVTHWESQANGCKNPMMRARYADLVWDLKFAITKQKPSPDFARIAVDSYLEATDKGLYPMEVNGIQWLGRALDLSLSINDSERTNRIVDFMFEFYGRVAQARLPGTWFFLFDNLYGQKFVSPDQQTRIIAELEAMLAKTADTKPSDAGVYENLDPWAAEAAAQRLSQHYHRLNDKPNVERVVKAYGNAFEHMAQKANPMMAMAWLQPVVERYEQEGLKADAERLQVVAGEKGKDIASDLKTVSVQADITNDDIQRLIDGLLGSRNLKTSLAHIAVYFLPKADDARNLLDKLRTDAPFLSMIPISIIEKDGFTTAKVGAMEDDAEGRLHQQLARTIGFYQPFLEYVLSALREQYAPKVDDVLAFLCESPLFVDVQHDLLRDGLTAYEQGDFVKAIHILVPQVEHILRHFLGRLGIPTRKTVRNHPGTTDVKNMNDILSDERMREKLTENLWRYLSVVYVDRRGLNLRNDLAHGLIPYDGFKKHIADRVFHTLLALSLMRAPKKEESPK